MANEFRIKHGLIITGSSYFSESMFAPNLPTETSPSYYITWRQSDGRFEISSPTAGTQATLGCWDYTSGDVTTGKWKTDNGAVGNTTAYLYIHKTDNNGVDQSAFFNNLSKGSSITLYVGGSSTTFAVSGASLNGNVYTLKISYTSGNEYSIVGTPEMCLGINATSTATAGTSPNCLEWEMESSQGNVFAASGKAVFDRVSGTSHWQTPFGTVDALVESLTLSGNDKNNTPAGPFFHNYYGEISVNYLQYSTTFVLGAGGAGTGAVLGWVFLPIQYVKGDLNYTIPTGATFTICKTTR